MSDFVTLLKHKGFKNYDDYSFLDNDSRLGDNIHLLVYGGSKAYGTNIPTSDIDIRGFATNAPEDIILGIDFETVTNNKTDTTIYSLDKLINLLSNCNPNTIEMLFVRREDILYADEIGEALIGNRKAFLSNKCIGTFGGYANQQLYKLQQKTLVALSQEEYNEHIAKVIGNMESHFQKEFGDVFIHVENTSSGLVVKIDKSEVPVEKLSGLLGEINNVIREYNKTSSRNEKALAHNKINKHAMHLIRLYKMATELLETGTVCTYRAADHDILMAIRTGKYSTEDGQMNEAFFSLVRDEENRFNIAKEHSVLPDKPLEEYIKDIHLGLNELVLKKYFAQRR